MIRKKKVKQLSPLECTIVKVYTDLFNSKNQVGYCTPDRVVTDPSLRAEFLCLMWSELNSPSEYQILQMLLNIRKKQDKYNKFLPQ